MFRVFCVSCKKLLLQIYTLTKTLDRIVYKAMEPMFEEEKASELDLEYPV